MPMSRKARQRTDRRVGVQRRQHEVAGERCLHGDLRRLEVADFADHHDVGILAQDGAQTAREGHLDLRVDLRLADAVDVVLDRILDRHDVARVVVEVLEAGIQRGGLAGAGRAGDENDAVRLVEEVGDVRFGLRVHAERRQVQSSGLLVEDTQHDAFAVAGRDGRDAHVHRTAGDLQADASVLRQPFLGDVEFGHDLEARDHQRGNRPPALQHFAQHAIDPKAHHQAVLERLDVDVGRVLLDRLREHRIDEANDRRVVFALEQVGLLGQVLREVRKVGRLFHAFGRFHGVVAGFIGLAQQRIETRVFDFLEADGHAEIAADFGQCQWRGAMAIDAVGDPVVHAAHENAVALGEREPHALRPDNLGGDFVHGFGGAASISASEAEDGGVTGASRGGSGVGMGGRTGFVLKGISGSTSPLLLPDLICRSRM